MVLKVDGNLYSGGVKGQGKLPQTLVLRCRWVKMVAWTRINAFIFYRGKLARSGNSVRIFLYCLCSFAYFFSSTTLKTAFNFNANVSPNEVVFFILTSFSAWEMSSTKVKSGSVSGLMMAINFM